MEPCGCVVVYAMNDLAYLAGAARDSMLRPRALRLSWSYATPGDDNFVLIIRAPKVALLLGQLACNQYASSIHTPRDEP